MGVVTRGLLAGALLVGAVGGPGVQVAQAADELTIVGDEVRVTVTGDRSIPVQLEQPATWDLSRSGDGLAGVTVVEDPNLTLTEHDEFGVALLSRGANDRVVTAVMFNERLEPILNYGQTGRLGLPRPLDDATTCARCVLPAGDYDLFVFGPWRQRPGDAAPQLTLQLEGLADGVTEIADEAGAAQYIVSSTAEYGGASAPFGGGGLMSWVLPFFYDGAERHGVYVTQAVVTAPGSPPAAVGELSLSAQVNNRPEVAPGERWPLQDAYTATARPTTGDGLYEVRTGYPTVLDRESPYFFAHGDTTVLNHTAWTMQLGMLWLTTSSDEPAPAGDPLLDTRTQTLRRSPDLRGVG